MKSVKGMLRAGFAVLLVFMILQALVTAVYLFQSRRDLATAVQQNTAASTRLAELALQGQALRRFEKEYFIYVGDAQKRGEYAKEWQQSYDGIMKVLNEIGANQASIWSAADLAEAGKWRTSAAAYGEGFDALRKKVDTGEISTTLAANEAIREAKDRFRVYLQGTTETLKRKSGESQQLAAGIAARFDVIVLVSALLFIAGCALLAVLAVRVPRLVEAPIVALAEAAESMSKGSLERPFELKSPVNEFRQLAGHLERMRIAQKGLLESLTRRGGAGPKTPDSSATSAP